MNEEILKAAREEYEDEDCQILDNARFSEADEGTWVEAWFWVSQEKYNLQVTTPKDKIIQEARDIYTDTQNNIEFDENAKVDGVYDGAWVQGWVWVYYEEEE